MLLCLLLSIFLLPHFCLAQSPVASPCEQHFTYLHEGNDYFGQIKLERLERGRTEIKVTFSQRDSLTSVSTNTHTYNTQTYVIPHTRNAANVNVVRQIKISKKRKKN